MKLSFRLFCGDTNIGDKTAEDFTILEDGDPISSFESDLQMVPLTASFQLSTALVLDMSGSMLESGRLPQLLDAVNLFINTTQSEQEIGIFLFDGRENLTTLQPFTSNKDVLLTSVDTLNEYESVDSSTNLNGAVVHGLARLDQEAAEAELDGRIFGGTLAIFTDGTDQAGRVSDEAAVAAVEASEHAVYSVGLGGEADSAHLADVGKSGALLAANVDELSTAFEDLAESIEAQTSGDYVIAYCSPKRAGMHTLELKLTGTQATDGRQFNADEFGSGCDPSDFVEEEEAE